MTETSLVNAISRRLSASIAVIAGALCVAACQQPESTGLSRKAVAIDMVARAVAPSPDVRLILRDFGVMNVAVVSEKELEQLEALLPMHAEVGAPMEDPQCIMSNLRPPGGCAVLSIEQYREHGDTVTIRVRVTGQGERGNPFSSASAGTEFVLVTIGDSLRIAGVTELQRER